MDIHHYDRRVEREESLLEGSEIHERDKELILKFVRYLRAKGIGSARISRYMTTLRLVGNINSKPFDEWDEEDVVDVLAEIESRDYSIHTKNEYRKGLRKFFRWLKGETWPGLKLLRGEKREDRKPDTLTEEEIMAMIEAAEHPRDKALIALGYEAGLRIGELAGLRIRDIIWNRAGAKIRVKGKTGERVIPIVLAGPYLRRWLDIHPVKEPDSYVFCSLSQRNFGQPLEYQSLSKVIRRAASKAGIQRRVNPHMLRHSRASVLANHLTEAQMCHYFGWVQGSEMPRIYVHLSGRDIDNAVYRIYGMGEEEEKEEMVKPIKCPRCGYVNAPTDNFCGRCALILDEGERLKLEMEEPKIARELMALIMQDPALLERLQNMIAVVEKVRENPEYMEILLQLSKEA